VPTISSNLPISRHKRVVRFTACILGTMSLPSVSRRRQSKKSPAAAVKARASERTCDDSHKVWFNALPTEALFWERWLETRGLRWPEDYQARTDPNTQLEPELAALIGSPKARIIDVGAGPLTTIGKEWKGHKLDVTAVDPLADEYSSLLSRYNVVPPIQTQKAEAESLGDYFPENSFDLAYARNCLDHSYDPLLAIRQMLHITKVGGRVYLKHLQDEGANERYQGLHQWNFAEREGAFTISAPAQPAVNVSQELGAVADISVSRRSPWIIVVMRKQ
jgi:SAM-dependent methyltransferase